MAPDQTRDIGLEEFVSDPKGICVVEWPEVGESYYPKDRLDVRLEHCRNGRTLKFKPRGPRGREILSGLGRS